MKKQDAIDLQTKIDFSTFARFERDLTDTFKSKDSEKKAHHKLDKLVMGKLLAKDHIARFQGLVIHVGLHEEKDLIRKFEQSLPEHIRFRISMRREPSSLKRWFKVAIKADNED